MKLKIIGTLLCLTSLSLITPANAQRPGHDDFFDRGREQFEEEIKTLQQLSNPVTALQETRLIERELFFGNPEIAEALISPDGKYISFLKPLDGVLNVWVKGIEEPFETARPVTKDLERPITDYFWSRDGKYILYLQDQGGDENFHIYAAIPPAPGESAPPARDLTPGEDILAEIIAIPEKTPDQIIIAINERDPSFLDVYRLNLTTGEKELLIQNDEDVAYWVTDLEGNVRLGVRPTEDGGTEILRVDEEGFSPIYTCAFGEDCYPIRFHKDGQKVYMATNRGQNNLTRLVLFNPETGEEVEVDQDPEQKVDFGDAIFSPVTEDLIGTAYLGDRLRIYAKDPQLASDLEFLETKLPDGELTLGSITEDGRLALVTISSDIDPGSAHLFNRETRTLEPLFELLPELNREDLAPMKSVSYNARDGLEIPAYLTIPKGLASNNLPVVIFPHGGPWDRDFWDYDPFVQFLANRGYAVFQPNFRGSTGYGKEFLNAGNKQWGRKMQDDLTDAVKYLVAQGIADPERIGIFGISYGGYASLAGLTFTPDLYAAGISYVGPSNIITLYESLPSYWESFRTEFQLRVGNPDIETEAAFLQEKSPFYHAEQINAPLMVIQGANDPRVPKSESDQIVEKLRGLGREVEYLVAPDEGHGFYGELNSLAAAAAIEEFFAEHLKGRVQESNSPEVEERLQELRSYGQLTGEEFEQEFPEGPEGDEEFLEDEEEFLEDEGEFLEGEEELETPEN